MFFLKYGEPKAERKNDLYRDLGLPQTDCMVFLACEFKIWKKSIHFILWILLYSEFSPPAKTQETTN